MKCMDFAHRLSQIKQLYGKHLYLLLVVQNSFPTGDSCTKPSLLPSLASPGYLIPCLNPSFYILNGGNNKSSCIGVYFK